MGAWIWVLIPLVAIIGGYIIDYQKNKLKWQNQTNSNEAELDDLRGVVQKLKTRIENLEAIAAGDSASFSEKHPLEMDSFDIDEEQIKQENRQNVANKVKSKGE